MTPGERAAVAQVFGLILGMQRAGLDAAADTQHRAQHIERVLRLIDKALEVGTNMGMLGAGTITTRTTP